MSAPGRAFAVSDDTVMFEELMKATKEKDRLKSKAYATIMTNLGGLNVELHGDRAPKTVYNFIQLAKEGKYDNTVFHRLIPGFMVGAHRPISQLTHIRFKEVTRLAQVVEARVSGASRSGTSMPRRGRSNMTAVVCSPWPTAGPTPTRPSSLLPSTRHPI